MARSSPAAGDFVRRTACPADGVSVYLLELDGVRGAGSLLDRLTEAERLRAGRLKGVRAAERFVARRWGLRLAIADATGASSERAGLEWDAHGRPLLGEGGLRVSTSSFGPLGLVALSRHAAGIDLLGPEAEAIAAAACLAIPLFADALKMGGTGHADPRRVWTHLEAALKGAGLGFNVPEAKGAVRAESWREDGPSGLRVDHRTVGASTWSALPLAVPEGFVASVVIPAG